ncbi:hypothetical protein [Paracoccus litorisediminis]|uniref:Uncharacterized protein n=1 Tax=Paracoccus litorisediminis TaxID=2006130 RepID=A0A844HPX5_9RHOB|nr:hypothetical protein [Paracoccus litorisediminis]MTH61189.1 hypothetical protein [Paracoccus litorisediminis]
MRFRKRPVVIEAIQFTGRNSREIARWVNPDLAPFHLPEGWWAKQHTDLSFSLMIPTLEGEMEARQGDWIIRGVAGEFYPCKPEIFDASYEAVEEEVRHAA